MNPRDGWRIDAPPTAPAAPYADYAGDARAAFWCFDEEMARATEAIHAGQRGKLPQLLSVTDGRHPVEQGNGEPVTPRFLPSEDGLTFRLKTAFLPSVPGNSPKGALWTGLPVGAALPAPEGGGPITLSRIVGPFVQTGPDAFRVQYGRAEYTANHRNNDLWLVAAHPGDERVRGIVQQAMVRAAPVADGQPQTIEFPVIADQPVGVASLKLSAISSAGLPVEYYVPEGPAEVEGDTLRFTSVPPRAKYPIRITVVAWQIGRFVEPRVRAAERVERGFRLLPPALTAP